MEVEEGLGSSTLAKNEVMHQMLLNHTTRNFKVKAKSCCLSQLQKICDIGHSLGRPNKITKGANFSNSLTLPLLRWMVDDSM